MRKIQSHFKSVFADWKHPFQNKLTGKEKLKCVGAGIGGAGLALLIPPLSPFVGILAFYAAAHY